MQTDDPSDRAALFFRSPVPHVVFDAHGRILDLNRAALNLLGAPGAAGAPPDFIERLDAYARVRFTQHLARVLRSAGRDEIEVTVSIGDTRHMLRVISEPLREAPYEGACVAVFLDETERVRALVHREARWERMRETRRLDALGLMAGGIAHDFNNLLQIVSGCAEQILECPDIAEARLATREILDTVDTAASVVHEILAFARQQPLQSTCADLNVLVGERMDMLRRVVGQRASLQFMPSPEAATAQVDVEQFVRVLLNLITNSRDAVREGGAIMILVRVSAEEGRTVELQVTDNGEGMDEPVRARVFEPFFTTRQRGRGTGLGLAVVHGIVTRHNGSIDVRSARGVGTTFTLRFPFEARGAKAPAVAAIDSASRVARSRVLVAEHDAEVRALIRRTLEGAGYDALIASDTDEASALCAVHGDSIDAMVLDVAMPGRDATLIARAMREQSHDLPVIFVTSAPNPIGLDRGPRTRVLVKPFAAQALLFHLSELFRA